MPRTIGKSWTDSERKEVLKLWNDGVSATQIAARFGVTRNSIIGIAHRANMKRPEKKKAPKVAKIKRTQGNPQRAITPYEGPFNKGAYPQHQLQPDQTFVTLDELTNRSCRWPLEKDGDHVGYCGEPKEFGSWCEHHARIASGAHLKPWHGKKSEEAA